MALRVLHVISDRERRGAQLFAVALSKQLNQLGHQSTVKALVRDRDVDGDAQGSQLDLPAFGQSRFSIRGIRALRQAMTEVDVTVAHGSTTVLATAMAKNQYRLREADSETPISPVVIRQIGDTFAWADSAGKRARLKWAYRRAAAVVALSDLAKQRLSDGFALDDASTAVIPNGIEISTYSAVTNDERLHAKATFDLANKCTIAYVGALSHEKGVDVLLDAIAELPEVHRVALLAAGDGPARASLTEQSERLGIDVRFVGQLGDVRPVLAAADLFVLPSRTESMPAALVEAGAAGLACVATRVGSVSEIVNHEVNGLLVAPDDAGQLAAAIAALADDPTQRSAMGGAGERLAQRYSIERLAHDWVDALTEAAQQ